MATNTHMEDDHRKSSKRSSGLGTGKTGQHIKRNSATGQFMSNKQSSSSKGSNKGKH